MTIGALLEVLPAKRLRVVDLQARAGENVEDHPLEGGTLPPRLEFGHVFVGPRRVRELARFPPALL